MAKSCSLCRIDQRVSAKFCDQCGNRLDDLTIDDVTHTASPSSPDVSFAQRLWDRAPVAFNAVKSSKSLADAQTVINKLSVAETDYANQILKIATASNETLASSQNEPLNLFMQMYIGRARSSQQTAKALNGSHALLTDSQRIINDSISRIQAEYEAAHKAWRKEADSLAKNVSKLPPSAIPSSKLPRSESRLGNAIQSNGRNDNQSVSNKLDPLKSSEAAARTMYHRVTSHALSLVEQIETDKLELTKSIFIDMCQKYNEDDKLSRATMSGLKRVRSNAHLLSFASSVASGQPCPVYPISKSAVRSPLSALISGLSNDAPVYHSEITLSVDVAKPKLDPPTIVSTNDARSNSLLHSEATVSRASKSMIMSPKRLAQQDVNHGLVRQPMRALRLDIGLTSTRKRHTIDCHPWIPSYAGTWAPSSISDSTGQLIAVESLLLSSSSLLHDSLTPASHTIVTALRKLVRMSDVEWKEFTNALSSCHKTASSTDLTLFPHLCRLRLIRDVIPNNFKSPATYSSFLQRQCIAILSILMYSAINLNPVNIPSLNGKVVPFSRFVTRLSGHVKSLYDVCTQSNRSSVTVSSHCDSIEECANDLFCLNLAGVKPASIPYQYAHNCYACVVYSVALRGDEVEHRPSVVSETSDSDDDNESVSMTVLHPEYATIMTSLQAFAAYYCVDEAFSSTCLIHVLLDIVADQSLSNDCGPLQTPALTSPKLMDKLDLSIVLITKRFEKRATHTSRHGPSENAVHAFCVRSMQHVEHELSAWISHYHQAPSVEMLKRVALKLANISRLNQPSDQHLQSTVEHNYLQEKKLARLLQRAAANQYRRVRSLFPATLQERQYLKLMKALADCCSDEIIKYGLALNCLVGDSAQSAEITVPCISLLLQRECDAVLQQHESVDSVFISILTALAYFNTSLTDICKGFSEPAVFAASSSLTNLHDLVNNHVKHLCYVSINRLQKWVSSCVASEQWKPLDEQVGCSESMVDTFRFAFDAIDAFFLALLASPIVAAHAVEITVFFVVSLNEVLSSYAVSVDRSVPNVSPLKINNPSFVDAAAKSISSVNLNNVVSMFTRAKDFVSSPTTRSSAEAALPSSVESLCVRACNLAVAQDRLCQLFLHVLSHWKNLQKPTSGATAAQLLAVEKELGFVGEVDAKLNIMPVATGDLKRLVSFGCFADAAASFQQACQSLILKLSARIVFVEWKSCLMTTLYFPLPSSQSASLKDSGLFDTIDDQMAILFQQIKHSNFSLLCESTLRYLLEAMEITLQRERKKSLFDSVGPADIAILEADYSRIVELFSHELNSTTIREIGQSYENMIQRLKQS